MRGRVFRNYYEGHMDKTGGVGMWGGGGEGRKGGRWVWLGWEEGVVGGKCRQL